MRRVGIGMLAVLLVAATIIWAGERSSPATRAQDRTEERLAALETRVAVLETAVAAPGRAESGSDETPATEIADADAGRGTRQHPAALGAGAVLRATGEESEPCPGWNAYVPPVEAWADEYYAWLEGAGGEDEVVFAIVADPEGNAAWFAAKREALQAIEAPDWARPWHDAAIFTLRILGDYGEALAGGESFYEASMKTAAQLDLLPTHDERMQAVAQAGCPAFADWVESYDDRAATPAASPDAKSGAPGR